MPRLGSTIGLVARVAELARLRAALRAAGEGTAAAVLLGGEAGVGKSRLLQEVARATEEAGGLVLTGRCLDVGEGGIPYLPFAEAVAELAAADPAAVQAWPALAPLVPGLELPEPRRSVVPLPPGRRGGAVLQDIGQLQLFDAVLGVLTAAAQRRPVLLAIEDVHWAESATVDLLSFVAARLRGQRLLLVATYRTDELHRRHPLRPALAELVRHQAVERMDLAPLSGPDSEALVRALAETDDEVPAALVADIAARCEGNAFFAEELLAARDARDQLPWTLAEVLLDRVERLTPGTQEVLRMAAVGGRWIKHPRLAAVAVHCGVADLDAALREAIGNYVLVVDGDQERYSFRHALLREAVYADLLPGERARLHAGYAAVIAGKTDRGAAAALAHHSMESHDLPTALAASVAAADEADRFGAPSAALRHTERALQVWAAVPEQSRPAGTTEDWLLRNASALCSATGAQERAVHYARSAVRAADIADDPVAAARSRLRLVTALFPVDGSAAEQVSVLDRAWEQLRDTDADPEKASALALRATALRAIDFDEARVTAKLAAEQAEVAGSDEARAQARLTTALIAQSVGDREAAEEGLRSAVDLAAACGALDTELRARFQLASGIFEHGDLPAATALLETAVARAADTGMGTSVYGLESQVGLVLAHSMTGEWDAGLARAEMDGRVQSGVAGARLAAVGVPMLVGRGRFADADRVLAVLGQRWGLDWQIAHFAGVCEAELHRWRGEPARAVASVQALLEHFASDGVPLHRAGVRAAAVALGACAELGDHAEGQRLYEHAHQIVGAEQKPWGPEGRAWVAVVDAEYARLTGAPDEVDRWQAAVDGFGYGEVYRQALARWRLAAALVAAERRTEAAAQLHEVLETAQRLGAQPLHEAATGLARRARLPGAAPRPSQGPLTERERDVLVLVADGLTNREVGARLYISEKTVSVHLSRAMSKLGATRRAEAVAVAYDRGLL